ncbi:MAG TPA: hypothetical protein VE619_04885, partial [Nitrososphaeraceae archaeon]|nr:hypothetical protein [Nitrososphaeraceae archaeon]
EASLIAISIGSSASSGSSSIKDLTSGYVRATSGFNLIAILADSSISETFEPLTAMDDAILYPSVLNPYTAIAVDDGNPEVKVGS